MLIVATNFVCAFVISVVELALPKFYFNLRHRDFKLIEHFIFIFERSQLKFFLLDGELVFLVSVSSIFPSFFTANIRWIFSRVSSSNIYFIASSKSMHSRLIGIHISPGIIVFINSLDPIASFSTMLYGHFANLAPHCKNFNAAVWSENLKMFSVSFLSMNIVSSSPFNKCFIVLFSHANFNCCF